MFSCFLPCLSSRGSSISNITSTVKDISLKAMKVQRQVMERESDHQHEGSFSGWRDKGRKNIQTSDGEVDLQEVKSTEWVADAGDGVLLTLVSLPSDGTFLKEITFSGDYDDVSRDQWLVENLQKILPLHSIERRSQDVWVMCAKANLSITQTSSQPQSQPDEERRYDVSSCVESQSYHIKETTPADHSCYINSSSKQSLGSFAGESSCSTNPRCQEEEEEESVQADDSEFTVEDDLGVYVTVRSLPSGAMEVVRVQFSPQYFGDVKAKVWWMENRERVQREYSR